MTDSGTEVSVKRGSREGVHQKAIGSGSESESVQKSTESTNMSKAAQGGINSTTVLLQNKCDSVLIFYRLVEEELILRRDE